MFTSIAKLRASSAQQNRVTTVENWLKRQNAAWTPDAKFPIAFIAHSNSVDDVSWVNGVTGTHVAWPELAEAVLKEFGHKTHGEHRAAMYEMLDARSPGKNKVLAETIVPKYNAAFKSLGQKADFGSVMWPFAIDFTAVAETPVAETVQSDASEAVVSAQEAMQTPSAQTDVFKPLAQVAAETAQEQKAEPVEADNGAVAGAMYVAVGKIMAAKNKSFLEACKYAATPTGGRAFTEYVEAFAAGVDVREVRSFLKSFNARADSITKEFGTSVATYLNK